MSTELIINASLPETRIALMEGGEIQELLIERASGKGIVGNIYKGRVTRVLPGMQAAFVDIGLEKAAFLYVDDVFVHSEIWEQEEGGTESFHDEPVVTGSSEGVITPVSSEAAPVSAAEEADASAHLEDHIQDDSSDFDPTEDEDDDEGGAPVEMGRAPKDGDDDGDNEDAKGNRVHVSPVGTIAPLEASESSDDLSNDSSNENDDGDSENGDGGGEGGSDAPTAEGEPRRRQRRGRRGGRHRRGGQERGEKTAAAGPTPKGKISITSGSPVSSDPAELYPESYYAQMADHGDVHSDRSEVTGAMVQTGTGETETQRPQIQATGERGRTEKDTDEPGRRPEFREQRGRDRRIRPRAATKMTRGQVNIQDLLQEGQEVIVQVAKDPIATKGARLTCHISLPGRHLVCMPTIDHVGVSRRIERDEERRRLREFVERNRPRGLGFIVRTASGKQSEKRIKQDIDYLTRLWDEIREKAGSVTAPALVYEDLNSVLRAIRDWVTEEIDKIIVDSRYHYNEMQRFVSHFMPSLKQKVELYHGDIPIFDAYNISTELSRALERKVWLKSGGYLVIDQAEALVAIDVNTGRYVGKKNLEDTILKTNLEAVQEIAYQLRLRNCGGIIILDLIDMEKEENKLRVYRALEEALKKDRARPTIMKISELGLIEMTRKRTRDTIIRSLCESCTHCEGKGFIKSKQTIAYEILRDIEREGIEREVSKILVQAHPEAIDILAIDERESLDQLERRYRKTIYLQAVTDFHPEQFEVIADKKPGSQKTNESILERAQISVREASRGDSDSNRERSSGGGERGDRNRRGRGGREQGRDRDKERDKEKDRDRIIAPRSVPIPIVLEGGSSGAAQSDELTDVSPEINVNGPFEQPREYSIRRGSSAPEGNAISTDASGEQMADGNLPAADPDDDFYDEEDRLAFLRAQAAQDAALAGLNAGAAGRPGSTNPRTNGGGTNRWGRNNTSGGAGRRADQPRSGGDQGGRGDPRRRRRGGRGRFGSNRPDRGPNQFAGPRDDSHSAPSSGPSVGPTPIVHDGGGDKGGSDTPV